MEKQTNRILPPASFLKTSLIMFLGFLGGQIALMIVSVMLIDDAYIHFEDTGEFYFYVVPFAAVLCFFVGNYIYKQKLTPTNTKITLKEKLINFQTAALLRYAIIKAAALFGIVIFLTTHNLYYLLIAMVMVLYYITLKPTKTLMEKDISFTLEQLREFQKVNQPIE